MYHFLDKPKSSQKFDWQNLSLEILCSKHKCSFSFSSDHEIIDVVDAPAKPHPSYDMAKARSLMHECDRHVNFARMEECPDDWEEQISRFKQTSVILQAGPHPPHYSHLIVLVTDNRSLQYKSISSSTSRNDMTVNCFIYIQP